MISNYPCYENILEKRLEDPVEDMIISICRSTRKLGGEEGT
jgi:hypothetical protein